MKSLHLNCYTVAALLLAATAPTATWASKPLSKVEALTKCQMIIKRAANDPSAAKIPYIEGIEAGGDFNFKWHRGSKLVQMRNGLGNEVSMPAFCSVNKTTGEVTQLNIDSTNIPLK